MMFDCGLQNIFRLDVPFHLGEKGKGGMASSDLGVQKRFPCIPKIRNTW